MLDMLDLEKSLGFYLDIENRTKTTSKYTIQRATY